MLTNDWKKILASETKKDYYKRLSDFVYEEYKNHTVYPPSDKIFAALEMTPLASVKVLILGQDPYHDEGQAHGLAFSVMPGQKIPPYLANIYKELHDDAGCCIPNHGHLVKWAQQGVLLLNTVLTVRAHEANSHKERGWEIFTDSIIKAIDGEDRPLVIMLWGSPAKRKLDMLSNPRHMLLTAAHPSPLSSYKGFFGCRHFSKANDYLCACGLEPIDWQIENI